MAVYNLYLRHSTTAFLCVFQVDRFDTHLTSCATTLRLMAGPRLSTKHRPYSWLHGLWSCVFFVLWTSCAFQIDYLIHPGISL